MASAGLQLYSGFQQAAAIKAEGQAANNYYQYQAKVGEQNAILAERTGKAQANAYQETQKLQGRQLKLSQAEFRASQTAALAASGISLSSVSAADIEKSTASKQAMDEATLRFNADTRSYEALVGAQQKAYGYRTDAAGNRLAGQNALYASKLNARSTLIGSAVGAFSSFAPLAMSQNFAMAGVGGYGAGTPYGVTSTKSGMFGLYGSPYSRLPGR